MKNTISFLPFLFISLHMDIELNINKRKLDCEKDLFGKSKGLNQLEQDLMNRKKKSLWGW